MPRPEGTIEGTIVGIKGGGGGTKPLVALIVALRRLLRDAFASAGWVLRANDPLNTTARDMNATHFLIN